VGNAEQVVSLLEDLCDFLVGGAKVDFESSGAEERVDAGEEGCVLVGGGDIRV
jgi:hypothetical protein